MAESRNILLVDGDMVAFSHAAAEEYGKEDGDISFSRIQMSIDSKMEFMTRRLKADKVITFMSGDNNFRFAINPKYKANRDGVWRPQNLKNAKAHMQTCWDACRMNGLEADDLLSCFAKYHYEPNMGKRGLIKTLEHLGFKNPEDKIYIASHDKDLKQISATAYAWETQTKGEKLVEVSGFGELHVIIKDNGKVKKKEVKGCGPKFFLWQMLTGDSTDGVMGCGVSETKVYKSGAKCGQEYQKRVGIGAIEAFELLVDSKTYAEGLNIVIKQYARVFGNNWEKELLISGRLLYMVNNIVDGNKALMWHYDTSVKHYFDLKEQKLVIPHNGEWVTVH
ncbi:hypothetical protein I6H07_06220 [Hafnia alvei]|nr:hypothetical protein [Hafnia alvei]MBI0275430.1 hypothetical protein [Hafnia alvei]PNK98576.1 hypothetical protein CEQ28_013775 [Hafnia alvei]